MGVQLKTKYSKGRVSLERHIFPA